ncbi:MAG TPA: hypothetical protein VG095_08705, partial [Chthoniobacterales bacterium]|nr:hypothetical protein [Chthoniobacterales bacterium]
FNSYVETIAENAFRSHLREDYSELRSLKDALRYLLSGRTKHQAFALWRSDAGRLIGGFAAWKAEGQPFTWTRACQQLIDDPQGFARAKLSHLDVQRLGRAELLDAIFHAVGGPIELDELVRAVAALTAAERPGGTTGHKRPRVEEGVSAIDELPTGTPDPAASLQSKSDLQVIWEDLHHLTLEQRRVLLLQAQHDVVEILLRAGVASIQEIAALLELPIDEVEELRCAGFLSDERLGRRFGFLKGTVLQQRHRARRRMKQWRKHRQEIK